MLELSDWPRRSSAAFVDVGLNCSMLVRDMFSEIKEEGDAEVLESSSRSLSATLFAEGTKILESIALASPGIATFEL